MCEFPPVPPTTTAEAPHSAPPRGAGRHWDKLLPVPVFVGPGAKLQVMRQSLKAYGTVSEIRSVDKGMGLL